MTLRMLAMIGIVFISQASYGDERPNILLIVADDLGYSDLGCYGGEMETPNVDALAASGTIFAQFYSAPTCSPTRAMLLTGADHHLVGLGTMAEIVTPWQRQQPGYEGYLNARRPTVAETLKAAGYQTYITGKWHLGMKDDQSARARGFDRSFVLLNGGASHFDDKPFVPQEGTATYRQDGRIVDVPTDFYSTDYFTERMLEFLKDRGRDKPFFAYLSYTAPHGPLHAKPDDIERVGKRYSVGFNQIKKRRIGRLRELGFISEVARVRVSRKDRSWDALSPEQRDLSEKKMAVYAAMVERVDVNIGQVLSHLKETAEFDNTLIVFLSDNGADGMPLMLAHSADRGWVKRTFDSSLAAMGTKDSFHVLGSTWAKTSSGILRYFKGLTSEGGIRVPCIVKPPGPSQSQLSHAISTVRDIAPTFLEVAGVADPKRFRGQDVLPMTGRSFRSVILGNAQTVHAEDTSFCWEFHGSRAVRQGDWKALLIARPFGPGSWELFNLAEDPAESNDLAAEAPQKLKQLTDEWNRYAQSVGIVDRDGRPVHHSE